jgi:hypothetical protein
LGGGRSLLSDPTVTRKTIYLLLVVVMLLNLLSMLFIRQIMRRPVLLALQVLGAVLGVLQVGLAVQIIIKALKGPQVLPASAWDLRWSPCHGAQKGSSPQPSGDFTMNDDGAPSGTLTWEWTSDWFSAGHEVKTRSPCCPAENPWGAPDERSYDGCQPNIRIPRKVLKGGSHLRAPCYCPRCRPAARHAESVDTAASRGLRSVERGPHG